MVKILEISYLSNLEAFADVAEALDPSISELPLREKAQLCSKRVQRLLDDIGIKVRLSDFGLTEKDIDKVTHIALTGYYFDISCHPLKVSEADIKMIYRECL